MMRPRRTPCASCPYRRGVPSGVWSAEEYDKLAKYDGTTSEQAVGGALGVFLCHQGTDDVCAGWASVHGDDDNLALRMAPLLDPEIDVDAVKAYTSDVPVFASGAEAAEHGKRDIEEPSPAAVDVVGKVMTVRRKRGKPVQLG